MDHYRNFNREGGRDRRKREGAAAISLEPGHSQLLVSIKSVADTLRYAKEPTAASAAIQDYGNIRYNRHELWAEYLEECKRKPEYRFGDTQVEHFVLRLTQRLHARGIEVSMKPVPDEIKDKSPDILFYDFDNACVFIGDIAVSSTIQSANKRKYEKYMAIHTYFETQGFRVCHRNFIVSEDLSNVEVVVNNFIQAGIIKSNRDLLAKYKHYHSLCNKIMRDLETRNSHPAEFARLKSLLDKEHTALDLNIDYETDDTVEPESLCIPEGDLINMIKRKTDENLDTFFDNGYHDAELGFNKLYDNFRSQEHHRAKSTLFAVYNTNDLETTSGYDLLYDYVMDTQFSSDQVVSECYINLLPTLSQISTMKQLSEDKITLSDAKINKVYGKWQYDMTTTYHNNVLTNDIRSKLLRGKKVKNEKTNPTTIDPDMYDDCIKQVETMITYLGSSSMKPSFLSDDWDAKTTDERVQTSDEYKRYMYAKNSNGAQLGQSLSMLYQRIMHLRTREALRDNIFCAPNGAFICIIPKNHAPFNKSDTNAPLIFICRKKRKSKAEDIPFEYEHTYGTHDYIYYVSKLCRLPLDKIDHWDQAGHRIVACSTFLLNISDTMYRVKERVIGTISVLLLDVHQKTSELLDLLKYVSFMPFSDISRLSKLIEDKFDIMLKTSLDVWVLKSLEKFMKRLSDKSNITAVKEKLRVFNGGVVPSSLGMSITIPSFLNEVDPHSKIHDFIEEVSMLNTVRGKHFYGSQFMDKSMTQTAEWNKEYADETVKYPGWTEGRGEGDYPFESKFSFSKDAIICALRHRDQCFPINKNKVLRKLSQIDYDCFAHKVCTLRGATKEKEYRENDKDLHTTSLDSCLRLYKHNNYSDKACNTIQIAKSFLDKDYIAQYTMSEKDQRGGGRPIATPTLKTKIGDLMIEKPEQAIGSLTDNNILVAGKHKLLTQSNTYKSLLEAGYATGKKMVFQCTEDQTKFSENDNTRKYEVYIRNNTLLPRKVKALQLACMKKMIGREHLIKRLPCRILESELSQYINTEKNGIIATIGWPQGMLNNISTSIHSIADYWITWAYNFAYGSNVQVSGLVHSDDSWFAIACDSLDEFKRFSLFRAYAKRMFGLKLNEKKLWGSRYMGELVSNFNINGEVLVPIAKVIANGLGNLLYQNWVMDVHNQISTIQQAYRQGCNLGNLIMLGTILRQQIMDAYRINKDDVNTYKLPIEMGGYPNNSVFELGVTGVGCHYRSIYEYCKYNPTDEVVLAIRKIVSLSKVYNTTRSSLEVRFAAGKGKDEYAGIRDFEDTVDAQFETVTIPRRGDVFSCIQHIVPKDRKVAKTLESIRELPFESDGLEMLVTKPNKLSVALGHLKAQMNGIVFELASQKYTSNKKRLAINQSIHSTGKTVRLAGFCSMNIRELVEFVNHRVHILPQDTDSLRVAFGDETNIVNICHNIVHYSSKTASNNDKRKQVNRMPNFEDKFTTVCNIRSILLGIVDKARGTRYREEYGDKDDCLDILDKDISLIKTRFSSYFKFYKCEYACNLIMQQYYDRMQPRLWTQPNLGKDDVVNFLEDLYGKTLNRECNFRVSVDYRSDVDNLSNQLVETLYSTEVLNRLYDCKFTVQTIRGKKPKDFLNLLDYASLNHQCYFKYSILCKVFNDDDTHLKNYDERKEYRQYYIRTQRFVNNKYTGDFIVRACLGPLVIEFEGEPEDLVIRVNKPLIEEIVRCMHRFCNLNFPDYYYNHEGSWHSSRFWRTRMIMSQMILANYGGNNTVIKKPNVGETGVSIKIDTSLKYAPASSPSHECTYHVDPYLRVVEKKYMMRSEHYGGGYTEKPCRIRVDNVRQTLNCPRVEDISLIPDLVDGFINEELLKTKVIFNITIKRSFSSNLNDIKKLLCTRQPSIGCKSVTTFFGRILSIFSSSEIDIQDIASELETETIVLSGVSSINFLDQHINAAPEDLTAVEVTTFFDEEDRIGALLRHTSLYRLFCKHLAPVLTHDEKMILMWYLIRNQHFMKKVIEYCTSIEEGDITINEIIDLAEGDMLRPNLIYLIVGNELDTEFITKEQIQDLVKNKKKQPPGFDHIREIASHLVEEILNLLQEENDPIDEELLARLG